MSYATVAQVKSMFRCLDDVTDPAVTDAEIQEFINETCASIDGCISELYQLPILTGVGGTAGTPEITTVQTIADPSVAAVPEITTVQTIAENSGADFVVWDVLEAGIIDEGNGGFSAVAGTTTNFAHVIKATGHGALPGEDFLLTYNFNGLAINNSVSLVGLSNNTNHLDYGSNQIFGEMKPGTGTFRFFYETALVLEPAITYAASNTLEFKRVGTVFTLKVDGVLVFTDPTMQNTAFYPMARPMGIDVGVYTSTFIDGGAGLNDLYFLHNIPGDDLAFYNNVDGTGTPPGVATTEYPVPFAAGSADTVVAAALQTAMDAVAGITATVLGNLVTANNDSIGVVVDSADVNSGFTVLTTQQGTAVGAGLNDLYFLHNIPGDDLSFFMNLDGAGTPPGVATTEYPVPISAGDTDLQNAAALQIAMDAVAGITATVVGNLVTANNDAAGVVVDSVDVNSGFTVLTTQQGVDEIIGVGGSPKAFLILQKLTRFKVAAVLDDILNSYGEADKKPTWGKQAKELLDKICPPKNPKTCKRCEPTMKLPDATFLGANTPGNTLKVKAITGRTFTKGGDNW